MCQHHDSDTPDINDLGLSADLRMLQQTPTGRRRILKMGAVGIGMLLTGGAALAQSNNATTFLPMIFGGASATTPTASPVSCVSEIPQETAGPYPADGSNASNQSLNVLTKSGIVRSDIRTSLGTGTTAAGIPLQMVLTLVNINAGCAPLSGYALYAWHCDREGRYSMYSSGVTEQDYLRGVQATESTGSVTFTSIFPACYSGRWPHVHFEIYRSLASATSGSNAILTSQLAFPKDVCDTVYATTGYESSVRNLSQLSLQTDNVFRDGYATQLASVTGDVNSGYIAHLTIGVDA